MTKIPELFPSIGVWSKPILLVTKKTRLFVVFLSPIVVAHYLSVVGVLIDRSMAEGLTLFSTIYTYFYLALSFLPSKPRHEKYNNRDSWREEAEAVSSEVAHLRETVNSLRQYTESDAIDRLLGQASSGTPTPFSDKQEPATDGLRTVHGILFCLFFGGVFDTRLTNNIACVLD